MGWNLRVNPTLEVGQKGEIGGGEGGSWVVEGLKTGLGANLLLDHFSVQKPHMKTEGNEQS